MADFTAPSFSLGIDLDFDSNPIGETVRKSAAESSSNVSVWTFEDDGDFDPETLDPDLLLEEEEEDPPPVLKRLRRGAMASSSGMGEPVKLPNVNDEIEEFSSQEDRCRGKCYEDAQGRLQGWDNNSMCTVGAHARRVGSGHPRPDVPLALLLNEYSTIQSRSACSSSKFSLHSHGVIATQPLSKPKSQKSTVASNAPTSTNLEAKSNNGMLPKLTISPLRKIQLLDSDSDDPSNSGDQINTVQKVGACTKDSWYTPSQSMTRCEQKANISSKLVQKCLWDDFRPKENVNLATPALDEFCKEYFSAVNGRNVDQSKKGDMSFSTGKSHAPDYLLDESKGVFQRNSIHENVAHCGKLPNPLPPAYWYFYHNDPRIQKLVSDRLPNFSLIGSMNHRGNQQSETTVIDYMSQFGHRDNPTQIYRTGDNGLERSSKKIKKNINANAKEVSQDSGSWVNPRSSATIPKDAGQRRVHAVTNAPGHWYTGEDGRKVYVNKNGEELTGRIAYRHYMKENGERFKKSRKKAAGKKPEAKKKSKR
ncbi:uncharacterized protein LOC143854983 isoform X1 [Tasmannia lanceolata]|uniref:uncharacterized protein LOC143854983 isoform X1 n=1 Tax=Tasmannia lanceolata TaxID=3420 RepID=UPI004063150A